MSNKLTKEMIEELARQILDEATKKSTKKSTKKTAKKSTKKTAKPPKPPKPTVTVTKPTKADFAMGIGSNNKRAPIYKKLSPKSHQISDLDLMPSSKTISDFKDKLLIIKLIHDWAPVNPKKGNPNYGDIDIDQTSAAAKAQAILDKWLTDPKTTAEEKAGAYRLGKSLNMSVDPKIVADIYVTNVTKAIPKSTFSFDVTDIISNATSAWKEFSDAVKMAFNNDKNALNSFASLAEDITLAEDAAKIDLPDFAVALLDKNNPNHKAAMRVIRILNNTAPSDDRTKGLNAIVRNIDTFQDSTSTKASAVDPAADSGLGTSSILPKASMADIRGKARDQVPVYIVDLFNNLDLNAQPSLKSRIDTLNELSKKIFAPVQDRSDINIRAKTSTKPTYGPTGAVNTPMGETIAGLVVLDTMNTIVRSFDASAAGWIFESFLAQLANGTAEGGDMGVTDFKYGIPADDTATTFEGSAKLLKKESFTQSATNLNTNLPNEGDSVAYIVGAKKGRGTTPGGEFRLKGSGKDTNYQVEMIDIYLVKIENDPAGTKLKYDGFTLSLSSEQLSSITKSTDGQVKFVPNEAGYIGTLYLGESEEIFNQRAEEVLKTISGELPALFKSMKKFNESTTSYLTGDRKQSASDSLSSYIAMFNQINAIFNLKSKETGVDAKLTGTVGKQITEEQKMKELDLMIENMVKQFLKGN